MDPSHHDTKHAHGHHHHDAPKRYDRAFAAGAAVNLAFVITQVGVGLGAHSMALLADAAHNFGDVLGLLLGWAAASLARRPPTPRRTYGWGRGSIFAALINAMVLLISVGAIGVEAIRRLAQAQPVATLPVIVVAAIGIVVNGGSALLFAEGRRRDLNIRTQFLHLGADALISAGVALAAIVIRYSGLWWIDPVMSLVIVVVIIAGTWEVLRQSVNLAMDAVPPGVAHEAIEAWLTAQPGVTEVHDLHIWGLSTTETALTAHLVFEDASNDRRVHDLSAGLRQRFGIGHATLQIESDADAALCRLRPNDVV